MNKSAFRFSLIAFFLSHFALLTSNFAVAGDGTIDILIDPATGYTITASGSYRLVGDVVMTAGASAITVSANRVTIDLGGHTIEGNGGASTIDGINAFDDTGVTVMNGTIRNFGGWGVICGDRARVRDILAEGNNVSGGDGGIRIGSDGIVTDCIANGNNASSSGNAHGIIVSDTCVVENNVCNNNTAAGAGIAAGILSGSFCVIRGNVCENNDAAQSGGTGNAFGISAASCCTVTNNTCSNQTEGSDALGVAVGIQVSTGCMVASNVCLDNDASFAGVTDEGIGIGILVTSTGCRVENNICLSNTGLGAVAGILGAGIYVASDGCFVERNVCSANTGGTARAGILVSATGDECLLKGNNTSGNGNNGIFFEGGSVGGYTSLNVIMEANGYLDLGTNTEALGELADVINP